MTLKKSPLLWKSVRQLKRFFIASEAIKIETELLNRWLFSIVVIACYELV